MRIGAAEFGVELAVVDDVIAVRAAGRGLQVRRAIEMADAQVSEIADDGRGIIEGEARMQLDTVGRRPRAGPPGRLGGRGRCGWLGGRGGHRAALLGEGWSGPVAGLPAN